MAGILIVAAKHIYPKGEVVGVLTAEHFGRSGLGVLDYLAPEEGCSIGDFVEVPLGIRRVLGVIWGQGESKIPPDRLRYINRVLQLPPMREELRHFLQKAADYTLTPLPSMLRLATRVPGLMDEIEVQRVYHLAPVLQPEAPYPLNVQQITEARQRAISVLSESKKASAGLTLSEVTKAAQCSASVVKGLVRLGVVHEKEISKGRTYPKFSVAQSTRLRGEQIPAGKALVNAVSTAAYSCTLLRGVTGSGKTEVYLEAVAECLRHGRQALVLLPEIALTVDFMERVKERFGAPPVEWHSAMSAPSRRHLWKAVATGEASFVAGARSALFLPFQDLGLIIVDEEHDASYKQEEGVFYNARDMAVLRGSFCDAAVVLASATPSLESWANAQAGKYARLDLSVRFGGVQMPEMQTIDMRAEKLLSGSYLSHRIVCEIGLRLEREEQSLLFLNRRGYAPVTLCRACGQQIGCSDCDARLVEHRLQGRLICHQCGASRAMPKHCPSCQVEGRLAALGPGVERLFEETTSHFPDAKIAVLSSDQFSSVKSMKEAIASVALGDADIIIGTQVVAKGHDFPLLSFVGIVDADLGLQGSDMRAAEHTFQLINQVAGRAGRRVGRKGLALLQTYQPDHPVICAILQGDFEAFMRAEASMRYAVGSPPYGRMAGIVLSSTKSSDVFHYGTRLSQNTNPLRHIGAEVYGPAPAPLSRLRGRYRARLLIKAGKGVVLQSAIKDWLSQFSPPRGLRISVDIDPQSFL